MQKAASEIKDEFSRKQAILIQEDLSKDETIKKLTATLIRNSAKNSKTNNHNEEFTLALYKNSKETKETEILTQRTGDNKNEFCENNLNLELKEIPVELSNRQRNKSFSACNTKTKSLFSGVTNEDAYKVKTNKLQGNRSQSRLKNMRKGSYYDKENVGMIFSSNISKNFSQKTIHETRANKTLNNNI